MKYPESFTQRRARIISELREKERCKYDASYFESEYWKEDLPGLSGNRGLNYDDQDHEIRFGILRDVLVNQLDFDTLLDAGCGQGGLVNKLAEVGKDVIGCDFSYSAARHQSFSANKQNNNFVISLLTSLPFKNNAFDVVYCSDVLEHLLFFDVESAISELARVSKKYIVATINLDNPYYYHPTILSRQSWEALFRIYYLEKNVHIENSISIDIEKHYPEYDFFVYEKTK